MTNKYAEGYPGRRYYGGCEWVDVAERLAQERARALFGTAHANVQPNSGSQANQGVFTALLKPGDTILGMSLAAGGHLTHGARPNQSGKWFHAVQYGVRRDDHLLDYDEVRRLAHEHAPKLIIAGGSAIPRRIDFARFRAIADEVGALPPGGHGALRRARRRRRAPLALSARPRRHHHHAQDAARPPRRHDPDGRCRPRQEDRLGDLSGHPGRATDARHRRQGGGLRRGAASLLQGLRRTGRQPTPAPWRRG